MKKSELKDGMKVVLNNGMKFVVLGKKLVDLNNGGFVSFHSYDDNDLSYRFPDSSEWGIKQVYQYVGCSWKEYPPVKKEQLYFLFDTSNSWVIYEGNKTTVLLSNGVTASTTCLPEDTYSEKKGMDIAVRKAIIKSLSKELKELTR